MADTTPNWEYSVLENNEYVKNNDALVFLNDDNSIDLLHYFGLRGTTRTKYLKDCTANQIVYLTNGEKKNLYEVNFSDWPIIYTNGVITNKMLLRATCYDSLSITERYLYVDPQFILVFVDGKYSKDWKCVDTTLFLNKRPEISLEIYLLQNFDYNIQDETHYYSKSVPEVGFTFDNLRINQFMEHHLNAKEFQIFTGLGLESFIKKDFISTRYLIRFATSKLINHNFVKIHNVVQNQSETYEDIIIRKKFCEQDTPWSKDFSLWAGVDDIYSISNSSSTMLYDQFGRLIDPVSIDWFNRRLAPFGDYDYSYVEIQHPKDRVYTGEIYYPAADHDPDEHIQRDPLNEYRYKTLYETNYKVVYLSNGQPYEYDTYFRKLFENIHMEETVYVKDKDEDYENEYTFSKITKKTETLLLDDILFNSAHENSEELNEKADVVTDVISVQIQSDTGSVRKEILTSKTYDTYQNDLRVEVPKLDSMLVFVDGKKQFENTYEKITETDANGKEHYYIQIDDKFAGATPEETTSHIVNVFYYNKNNLKSFVFLKIDKYDIEYNVLVENFKKIVEQVLLFEHRTLHNDNILIYNIDVPLLLYVKNTSSNGPISLDSLPTVVGSKLTTNVVNLYNYMLNKDGCLLSLKMNSSYLNMYMDEVPSEVTASFISEHCLEMTTVAFSYVENGEIVSGEIPLALFLESSIFDGFELEAYLFDIGDGEFTGEYGISIDKCKFNSYDQGFVSNNLRKNIYMEHYDNVSVFHSLKAVDLHLGIGKNYITFHNVLEFPLSYFNNMLIKMCEFRGVINNFDTVDNNLYYGSIPVRNFIDESKMGANIAEYDHVDWNVGDDHTVSFEYHFEFENAENLDIIISDDILTEDEYGNVIFKAPLDENDNPLFNVDVIPNTDYIVDIERHIIKISYQCETDEEAQALERHLETCYIYTREQDFEQSYIYDMYINNVFKLEQEMNRFSSMLFDKSGYLICPNSIDWVYTEFNYPMYDNQISILPLNSEYPAVIGEVYENSLEREMIMNLCLDDIIMFVQERYDENELHRIGGDIQNGVSMNQDSNGWDIAVPRRGWDMTPEEIANGVHLTPEEIESGYKDGRYLVEEEKVNGVLRQRNRYIAPEGYYDDIIVPDTGLTNTHYAPVDFDLEVKKIWENLCNLDYVYWSEGNLDEDIMKIIVNFDDYINKNVFAFINGMKVLDEDFEMEEKRNIYRIYNFSKYKTPRYKAKKYSSLNGEQIVYIDEEGKYTFDVTDTAVAMEDDSLFAKAEYTSISELFDNTEVLCLAGPDKSREIVCYNYNPDDIEYCLKINTGVRVYKKDVTDDEDNEYSEYRFTINNTYCIDSRNMSQAVGTDGTIIQITNNKFEFDGIEYGLEYENNELKYVKSTDVKDKYVFPGYYDYDLKRYSLVFVNGLRYKKHIIKDEEMVLNINPTDKVEIYIFKKYDYNWIDEVRYDQYNDNRYFSVHNLKTVRMV